MPTRLSGGLKPDGVIPFKTGKEDAKAAFLRLCKGKPLLPRGFTSEQRLEKITGMYVPFWLYDCAADFSGSYKATRIHTWSDSKYEYTKTDHFLLKRDAAADFVGIPMDGSTKMEDAFMESIEPFDYKQLTSFDMAYLTGYLADKYDVPSENGEPRVRQRVDAAMDDRLQSTFAGSHLPAAEHQAQQGTLRILPRVDSEHEIQGQNLHLRHERPDRQNDRRISHLPQEDSRMVRRSHRRCRAACIAGAASDALRRETV